MPLKEGQEVPVTSTGERVADLLINAHKGISYPGLFHPESDYPTGSAMVLRDRVSNIPFGKLWTDHFEDTAPTGGINFASSFAKAIFELAKEEPEVDLLGPAAEKLAELDPSAMLTARFVVDSTTESISNDALKPSSLSTFLQERGSLTDVPISSSWLELTTGMYHKDLERHDEILNDLNQAWREVSSRPRTEETFDGDMVSPFFQKSKLSVAVAKTLAIELPTLVVTKLIDSPLVKTPVTQ